MEEEEYINEQSTSRSIRSPTVHRHEDDLIDRLGREDAEEIGRRQQMERSHALPYDMVRQTMEDMAAELQGMDKLMDIFRKAMLKDAKSIEYLDNFFKSREARVGMLNSIITPEWAFTFLEQLVGSSRNLMGQLDALVSPSSSPEIVASIKSSLSSLMGSTLPLDVFIKEFNVSRSAIVEVMVSKGMAEEAARVLLFEALSDNHDAQHQLAIFLQLEDPSDLLTVIKCCQRKKLSSIIQVLPATLKLDPTLLLHEESEKEGDSSLLAQLDEGTKQFMEYDRTFDPDHEPIEERFTGREVEQLPSSGEEVILQPMDFPRESVIKSDEFSSVTFSVLSGSSEDGVHKMKRDTLRMSGQDRGKSSMRISNMRKSRASSKRGVSES